MTIEEARKLLWDAAKDLSDEDIQRVIDFITSLWHIGIESYLSERKLQQS